MSFLHFNRHSAGVAKIREAACKCSSLATNICKTEVGKTLSLSFAFITKEISINFCSMGEPSGQWARQKLDYAVRNTISHKALLCFDPGWVQVHPRPPADLATCKCPHSLSRHMLTITKRQTCHTVFKSQTNGFSKVLYHRPCLQFFLNHSLHKIHGKKNIRGRKCVSIPVRMRGVHTP